MTTLAYTARPVERSMEQRMEALERANRIRIRRAEIKAQLKSGELSGVDVLTNLEDATARMRVRDLLRALPKMGPVKANQAMRVCRIAESKTLGGVSDRQRGELLRWLESR